MKSRLQRIAFTGMSLFCLLVFGITSLGDSAEMLPGSKYGPGLTTTRGPASAGTSISLQTEETYLPLVSKPPAVQPWIDPKDRKASLNFFLNVYLASEGVESGWNGSHAGCNAGDTSAEFKTAITTRINYFRSMAGLPMIQLSDEFNRKAQQAALMMSVNRQLSHDPPPSWLCYTEEGAQAAGSSNLFLGRYGPGAITGYIEDPGSGNFPVGHRRWILYPQTELMGTGDIPPTDGYMSSNALWVFDDNMWNPRPGTREEFVAWPPPGYVPYQVVFPRWSFAYAGADFSAASVTMSISGDDVPVTVLPVVNGYGENTLVWEPSLSFGLPPTIDSAFEVSISGVYINGALHNFTYQVIIFEPRTDTTEFNHGAPGKMNEPPAWPSR